MYMYKEDLVLNNQWWLICHKTKPKHLQSKSKNEHLRYFDLWLLLPSWMGCRIYWLHLCRGLRPPTTTHTHNESPRYDTKQSDGEVPVMLELWGMWRTPSLPLLPCALWPGMVAPEKGPNYNLNRTNSILMLNWIVWIRTVWLNWIAWNGNVFDN